MTRRKLWLFNRVVLGLLAFLVVTGFWEFKFKPQYRPFYEDGVHLYQAKQYEQAQVAFDRAYEVAPNAVDVIVMEGWNNLKLNHMEEARYYFTRALRIDPRTEEAQVGMSFVTLETGKGDMDPGALADILQRRKDSPDVMLLLASAEERRGQFFPAAQIYSRLQNSRQYGREAQDGLQSMFGLQGSSDQPITELPPVQRPAQLQFTSRAAGSSMQSRTSDGNWRDTYVQGVDLGAAAPGFRPNALPNDVALYGTWLKDASQLNANTLRVYTLLPPAFYRAFHHYAKDGGDLSLIQQVYVGDPGHQNLFEPGFEDITRAEIRYVVDAIHGHGLVPPGSSRGSGVYPFDITDRVRGFIIGRDMDPQVVNHTNVLNAGRRAYTGKYLSVNLATPTEVWLTEMADYLLNYETTTYNWQHPVAMASGPAPDPSNTVLLEGKIKANPDCAAGFFAAYPAYPFYPEYMEKNPKFARAVDKQGPNPVYGLVREMRAHLSVPLVVSEYGVSTSMEPRHVLASGWNQGGYSDKQQADALVRLTRSLRDAGSAGSLVFELADEWYRQGGVNGGFPTSADRSSLSLNDLDPAKRYGLVGYRTSKWELFTGNPTAWDSEKRIDASGGQVSSDDKYAGARTLKSLQVASDEGYLYFRLQVACLDCVGSAHTGKTHFDQAGYAFALKTLPGSVGIRKLPFGNAQLSEGANFLLVLKGSGSALLVADNFNPLQLATVPEDGFRKHLVPNRNFAQSVRDDGNFVPVPQEDTQSQLQYGEGDPAAPDYDSRAQWYADVKHNAILVRIPWAKLFITDPSKMVAFAGFDRAGGVRTTNINGLEVNAYALTPKAGGDLKAMTVAAALPTAGTPAEFAWTKWDTVRVEPFRKRAFFAIADEFARNDGKPTVKGAQKTPAATAQHGAKGK